MLHPVCCSIAAFWLSSEALGFITVDGQTTMLLLPPPFQQSSIFVVSKELTQVCFRLLIRGDSNNDLLAHTILILCIASSYEGVVLGFIESVVKSR